MSFNFSALSKQLQSQFSGASEKLSEASLKISETTSKLSQEAKKQTKLLTERFNNEDVSTLPEDYILLEQKCDTMQKVFKRLLIVSQTYEVEGYDYPPNLSETITVDKLLNFNSGPLLPHSFAQALAIAAKESREKLAELGESPLCEALGFFSDSQYKIDNFQKEQNELITNEFNKKLTTVLSEAFTETSKLRKKVEDSRLKFDTLRRELKIKPDQEKEKELEALEDQFVTDTMEAVEGMKKLIDPTEIVHLMVLFAKFQLEFHKQSMQELEKLVKGLEGIPLEEEDEEGEDEGEDESD